MRFHIVLALTALLVLGSTGAAWAGDDRTGTLVFQHDATGVGALHVTLLPFGVSSDAVYLGSVDPGESFDETLPVGTHQILLDYVDDGDNTDPLAAVGITIEEGQTTTLETSNLFEVADTGTFVFEHDADGAGTLTVIVVPFGDRDDSYELGSVDEGESFDETLPVGAHEIRVLSSGGAFGSTAIDIGAGQTTTLRASSLGDAETGRFVFQHDADGAGTLSVYLVPFGEGDSSYQLGFVDEGESFDETLPVGTHEILVSSGSTAFNDTSIEIEAGETTTLRASSLRAPGSTPTPRPTSTPTAIRTPSRVETGAGGTAEDAGVLVVAGLAGLVTLAGAGALRLRGRRS